MTSSDDDIPGFNMDGLNQEDSGRQDQQDDLSSQNSNYGIGHMNGGVVQDGAQIIGKSIKKHSDQFQDNNFALTVNVGSPAENNISYTAFSNAQDNLVSFEMTISGELPEDNEVEFDKLKRKIENILKKLRDLGEIEYNLKIRYLRKGSIKIGLEGYSEDFNKLQKLFETGELSKILDIPIENISLISTEDLDKKEAIETAEKSRLIEEIKIRRAGTLNPNSLQLIRANLSGANLKYADLNEANLFNANLEYADLERSKLRNANLKYANLRHANLKYADLRHADLRYSNLRNADLSEANVKNAYFVGSLGISEPLKQDLTARGAIFKDAPEDRSGVLSRT